VSAPRLLFDENLSPRLVGLLADDFPGSSHVDQAGLHGRSDAEVWAHARDHGLVLVSKDNDFRQMSFLRGAPPKIVWLRIGNAPTQAVAGLLRSRRADVESFVGDAETALLAVQIEAGDEPK
jgi:predicted nuclease of predicted toxin-antitoxin system